VALHNHAWPYCMQTARWLWLWHTTDASSQVPPTANRHYLLHCLLTTHNPKKHNQLQHITAI
jgi:hypothetical protein